MGQGTKPIGSEWVIVHLLINLVERELVFWITLLIIGFRDFQRIKYTANQNDNDSKKERAVADGNYSLPL